MNFQLTPEHEMLRRSVASTFTTSSSSKRMASLADIGVFGLLVGEDLGGSAMGMTEAAIVIQEAGRAGASGTLGETLLLADAFCRAIPDRAAQFLTGQVSIVAATSGALEQTGDKLVGAVSLPMPKTEDWIAAPIAGTSHIALLHAAGLVPMPRGRIEAGSDGCSIAVDITKVEAATVSLNDFFARAAILSCAELLGAAEHCFTLSVAYLNNRIQFGRPIGSNQALKHIAADSYLSLENMRVTVEYAAAARDAADVEPGAAELATAVEQAVQVMLTYVPRTARQIAETAIHLHGGIGLTWEYGLNAYLRRIVRVGMGLGAVTSHRLDLHDMFRKAQRPPIRIPAHRRMTNGAHHDRAV